MRIPSRASHGQGRHVPRPVGALLSHTTRALVSAGLTANAITPLRTKWTAPPAFAAGWLTSELAPQILVGAAADLALAVRRGRTTPVGVAAAVATVAGLALVIQRARGAGEVLEDALCAGIGEDYRDRLAAPPTPEELRTPALQLARPFRMSLPGVEVLRNLAYTEGGRKAKLDIYRPEGDTPEGAPVLIQIHGGGWSLGSKEQQGLLLMNRMASRGWVCVSVNYRLAPRYPFPTQIIDVKRAIAWVRGHIAEYGGDPDYLVLTGGSAGGHLASLAALTPGLAEYQPGFEDADTHVAACVPLYGVYDMAGEDGDRYTVGMRDAFLGPRVFRADPAEDLRPFELASPLQHVGPEAPDFLVIHGRNDTLVSVRQARAFVERLRRDSRASVTYAELPGTQHAFEVFGSIRSHATIKAIQRWLEWHHAGVASGRPPSDSPATRDAQEA